MSECHELEKIILSLPPAAQQELLDFVSYLHHKYYLDKSGPIVKLGERRGCAQPPSLVGSSTDSVDPGSVLRGDLQSPKSGLSVSSAPNSTSNSHTPHHPAPRDPPTG